MAFFCVQEDSRVRFHHSTRKPHHAFTDYIGVTPSPTSRLVPTRQYGSIPTNEHKFNIWFQPHFDFFFCFFSVDARGKEQFRHFTQALPNIKALNLYLQSSKVSPDWSKTFTLLLKSWKVRFLKSINRLSRLLKQPRTCPVLILWRLRGLKCWNLEK